MQCLQIKKQNPSEVLLNKYKNKMYVPLVRSKPNGDSLDFFVRTDPRCQNYVTTTI